MIDLAHIETRQVGKRYELQCPQCGAWVRELLILSGWVLVCRECIEAQRQKAA